MSVTLTSLTEQLGLADELRAGRDRMLEPQDLPGRYGRVIRALDHVLQAVGCEAVVVGGWAVWRHGVQGRVTQDVDIVLAADRIDDFVRKAGVEGFELLHQTPGRRSQWTHRETGIQVEVLPEGQRPGTASKRAPTTIPHPSAMGASGTVLRYVTLPALIELKVAAGRAKDETDVVELIRANPDKVEPVRQHLGAVHPDYAAAFDRLVQRARDALHDR
jgi:hypothetical protein